MDSADSDSDIEMDLQINQLLNDVSNINLNSGIQYDDWANWTQLQSFTQHGGASISSDVNTSGSSSASAQKSKSLPLDDWECVSEDVPKSKSLPLDDWECACEDAQKSKSLPLEDGECASGGTRKSKSLPLDGLDDWECASEVAQKSKSLPLDDWECTSEDAQKSKSLPLDDWECASEDAQKSKSLPLDDWGCASEDAQKSKSLPLDDWECASEDAQKSKFLPLDDWECAAEDVQNNNSLPLCDWEHMDSTDMKSAFFDYNAEERNTKGSTSHRSRRRRTFKDKTTPLSSVSTHGPKGHNKRESHDSDFAKKVLKTTSSIDKKMKSAQSPSNFRGTSQDRGDYFSESYESVRNRLFRMEAPRENNYNHLCTFCGKSFLFESSLSIHRGSSHY